MEIRHNEDGSAYKARVHLEQMSNAHWWMEIEQDGKSIMVNFYLEKRSIKVIAEQE